MYRGKKSTYEKVAEAATAEEIYKELQFDYIISIHLGFRLCSSGVLVFGGINFQIFSVRINWE